MKTWEDKVAHYNKIVAQTNQFDRKGKTMPYTSANGYMFSFINKEGEFGIRFSKERCQELMELHNTGIFKSHGATMRDYVHFPAALFKDEKLMLNYLKEGFAHVMSLKPK